MLSSVPYHKTIKRICGRNSYDSNHEALEQVDLPIFKRFLAKKTNPIYLPTISFSKLMSEY